MPGLLVDNTNQRHFKRAADGQKVFPLVATIWSLFSRTTIGEVTGTIIPALQAAGVNGVAAVLIDEVSGPAVASSNGHLPFTSHTWTDAAAAATTGYWAYVQEVIDALNGAGIMTFLLPTWGKWVVSNEAYCYFSPLDIAGGAGIGRPANLVAAKARALSYGNYLTSTLTGDIVWVLGGDVGDGEDYWLGQNQVWDAISEGLADGAGANVPVLFHPGYASFTTANLHTRVNGDGFQWLMSHGSQAAHFTFDDEDVYLRADAHYARSAPVRPFGELEAFYYRSARGSAGNDPPAGQHDGRYADYDQRLAFWWSVGRGGAVFWFSTFALWQLYKTGRTPVGTPENQWMTEIASSGVAQLKYSKWLIDRLPASLFFSRTQFPNATLLASQSAINQHHKVATGNWDGAKCSWAYVYFPASGWDPVTNSWAGSHSVAVDLTKFDAAKGGVRAWWYNPRTGMAAEATSATPAPISGNTYARASTTFTKPHDAGAFANSYDRGNDAILFLVSGNESEGETGFNGSPAYQAPDTTPPTLQSATVGFDGVSVTLVFDEPITEPPVDGNGLTDFKFFIDGDGDYRATLASQDGATVILTLFDMTVYAGVEVLVHYDDQTGAITDLWGNALAPFPDVIVVNNSAQEPPAPTPPTLVGAVVSADGLTITLSFSEPVELAPAYDPGDFSITAAGSRTISGSADHGDQTITLTLAVPIPQSVTVFVSYANNHNGIVDLEAGTPLATFFFYAATNNSTVDTTPPQVTSAVIAADGLTLSITFNEAVTGTPTLGWAVHADGQGLPISGGTFGAPSSSVLTLNLGQPVLQGQSVALSYDLGSGDVQDAAGNPLQGFVDAAITNNSAQRGAGSGAPPATAALFVQLGRRIDYTAQANIPAGAVVVQGELVGVARRAIPAGAIGALAVEGVFDFPKASGAGSAIMAGVNVYWDSTASQATTVASGNKLIGKSVRAAADADTTVRVRLSQ